MKAFYKIFPITNDTEKAESDKMKFKCLAKNIQETQYSSLSSLEEIKYF